MAELTGQALDAVGAFIARWERAEAAERANYQMFLAELCDLLELPRPDPATAENERNAYVFDRALTRRKADGKERPVWANFLLPVSLNNRCSYSVP